MTVRCSVFIATSLDGFIARKNGGIDWLMGRGRDEGGEDYGYGEFIAGIDTLVMGRNSYELALTFKAWPYAGKKVVVLSRRSPLVPQNLADSVAISSAAPADVVRHLAEQGARHLYIDGGATIQEFLRAGLIHDITITRIPVLIGGGIPLFGDTGRDIRLRHIATRAFQNGFVQSKYEVVKAV